MKKLFFTAIALVAFSGVSMASTDEIKKSVDNTKCDNQKKEVIITKNCDLMVSSNLSNWEEMYGCIEDSNAYNSLYRLMYAICMTSC